MMLKSPHRLTKLHLHHKIAIAAIAIVVIAIALLWRVLLAPPTGIQVGEVYVKQGLPDSSLVATIYELAPNIVGEILVGVIAYDRPIKIDQIAPCASISALYASDTELTAIPLFIDGEDIDCFSYRIRFDFEDQGERLPFPLAMIHPIEHTDLLADVDTEL